MKIKFLFAFFVFMLVNFNIAATENEYDLKGKIDSIVLKTVSFEKLSLQRSLT